ncbi:cytochrome C [Sulfurimonas microaerophilic]|uniref:cytochrome C n=1 Tax=Sulfurimonas microaerophilic TaxID=3058392 RepID=UPI0027151789|nr:cytochrome C [Sulfurimonas sp. hsl 1-7]
MTKTTSLVLSALVAGSVFATSAMADASKGQRVYLKKLKSSCKKDGLKTGADLSKKKNRKEWEAIHEAGKLKEEWIGMCPSGEKKINKLRDKDIEDLYDFCWKYANDGEMPACG